MNTTILKEIGNILGREQIVIAVRSFNSKTNKLEGHTIFLYSDKSQGISIYSNGCTLSGKYKSDANREAVIFQFNEKYNLPWVSSNSTDDRMKIKQILSSIISSNKNILIKHNAVKTLIANYEEVLKFCVKSNYMKLSQLNHVNTQIKFKHINNIEINEIAVTKDEPKLRLNAMQLAHALRKKLIAEDEDFAKGHYSAQMKYCLKTVWAQIKGIDENKTTDKKEEIKPIESVENTQDAKSNDQIEKEITLSNTSLNVLNKRSKDCIYITFSPANVYIENCYGQTIKHLPLEKIAPKLKNINISYTERFFVAKMIKKVVGDLEAFFKSKNQDINVVILHKTPNVLIEGYIGQQI